jgi:hypothetical protein
VFFVVEQRAAEGPLGPLGSGDYELLRSELRLPFRIGFDNGSDVDWSDKLAVVVEEFDLHV